MHNQSAKDEKKNWLQNICCTLFKKEKIPSLNSKMKKCDLCAKRKPSTTGRLDSKCYEKTEKTAMISQKSETAFHKNSGKQSTRKSYRRHLCRKIYVRRQKPKYYPVAHPVLYPILRYFLFWCPCFKCCTAPRRKIRENCCVNCVYKKKNVKENQNRSQCSDQVRSVSTEKMKNTKKLNKQSNKKSTTTVISETKSKKVSSPKQKKHGTVHACEKNGSTVKSTTNVSRNSKVCTKRSRCRCFKRSLNVEFQRPPKFFNRLGFKFLRKCDLKHKCNTSEANSVSGKLDKENKK